MRIEVASRAMTTSSTSLLAALRRMSPRAAQVVIKATIDGRSLEELAQAYGVSGHAMGILLMRSIREFEAALDGHRFAPQSFDLELAALPEFLDRWKRRELPGPVLTLVDSPATRQEVKAGLEAAAAAEDASPRGRLLTWLRWVAILLIVALSAYLYWRDEIVSRPPIPRIGPR